MATLWISLFLIAGAGPTSEVDPPNFQSEAEAPIPAAPEVVKPSGTELSIVYTSRRGCFLGGSTHIDAIDLFKSVAEREKFSFEESSLGIGVYFKDGRYLIPEKNFADPTLVSRILSDKTPLERSVIESGVMLLESEFSAIVQFPRRERRDMLALIVDEKKREHGHNDMEQRQVDVVRYKSPLGSLVAIEPPGQLTPIDRDPLSWIIQPSLSIMAGDEDGESRVLFLGKRQGTPGRIKADFDERVARAKDPIRVYPGMTSISKEGKCGETLKAFGFDVLVPHRAELELGAKEFIAFQKKHQLNYTVSNLRLAKEKSLVAPRFVIKTLKGKNVVFVSVVPRSLYEVLPESAQRSFAFLDPWQSLQEALKSARERLGKKPDLVVAIASGNDAEAQQRLTEQLGVDIVMGDFSRWAELVGRTETARLSKEYGGREDLLLHRSSFVVRASPYSTGSLRVSFEQGRLSEIQNESRTSTQSGPNDEAFSRQRRAIARKEIEAEARVLFPDVMPIIKADDTLMSMATGERVLSHGIFKKIDESAPRFSDPVWMRMVTNIVREEMDADVAIISNLARGDNVIGPALRLVVRTWLPKQVEIERTTMTGAQLQALAARLSRQERSDTKSKDMIFTSGFDSKRMKVRGRKLDPKRHYPVAIDSTLVSDGELKNILPQKRQSRFSRRGKGYRDAQDGARVRLRELVFSYFEEFENSKTKEFDPKYQQEFKRLLTDSGQTLEGEWSFDIDGLSLSFSALRNSDNIGLFADSRETRTTTPNLFNLGTSANLKLLYDGPSVAFETGLRAQLQSIFLNVEGQDIPPQEQRDDLLTYVEGRANLVRLSIGDGDMQLVPFSRFALDSEFTPTPENPAEGTFYPHQLLFRQELGVVLNPPKHVQEIRIGALIQEDMGSALGGATSFWITEQPLGQR